MKLKIHNRIKAKELFFYIAIIFYCADYYINASLLDYKLPGTFSLLLQLVVLLCLFIKWILTEKYTLKKLICILIIMISSGIVAINGNYRSLLLFICVVFSSTEVEFDKIMRLLEANIWIWMLAVIFLCKAGFLQDYTYWHNAGTVSVLAHSWGFKYYSWLGYTSMALSMMWVYRHKNINAVQSVVLIALNYIFYRVHTTNLPLMITIVFTILCYLNGKNRISRFMDKIWKITSWVMPFGLYIMTWILIWMYNNGRILMDLPILKTIVSRMKFSVQALETYGLHLFGTHVIQIGNVDIYYKNVSSTNAIYIDSGFVYSTIAYGILLTLIFLIAYTWIGVYLCRENNHILYIWLLLMMIACCVNNFMCDIINNPIIFLMPTILLQRNQKLRIYIKRRK